MQLDKNVSAHDSFHRKMLFIKSIVLFFVARQGINILNNSTTKRGLISNPAQDTVALEEDERIGLLTDATSAWVADKALAGIGDYLLSPR